ncbi:hypothetical protein PG999_013668 [Apiospora kogelbergensis]|uniref:Uncharacterized protein n=1 Tax=Apiospora kogelbergensis TaxID=1337665 RepID=A0AAW0Q520_9PEZI
MVSLNSTRNGQSLARVAALGPYARVDQMSELRGKASNDSIVAVVATRPDAEELTARRRERRRSTVSSSSHGDFVGSRGRLSTATVSTGPTTPYAKDCSSTSSRKPRARRDSVGSDGSYTRDRASLLSGSISGSISSARYSPSLPSPPPEQDRFSERRRTEQALCGDGDSSAVVNGRGYHDRRGRQLTGGVLRPTHGNTPYSSSPKAKSETGHYLGGSSRRDDSRRQSRAYPPRAPNPFDEVAEWAVDALKGVPMVAGDNKRSSSSHSSRHHDSRNGRRSSTATMKNLPSFLEQEPNTPTSRPRGRKNRSVLNGPKSVSGATNNKYDAEDVKSTYSGYSNATYAHNPRYDTNPYYSTSKRTSQLSNSGVGSSRAHDLYRDLTAAADYQRKMEQEQEKEREQEREREREREHRRRQKQKQKEILRVDSVDFEMYSIPTPKSAVPESPVYDVPSTNSRKTWRSSRATTTVNSPSQEPASSFNVVGVYRTETLSKSELEPLGILNKSNFMDGEVYDNSNDHDHRSRHSRQYSRDVKTTDASWRGSRASSRSLSPARIMEAGAEFKNRISVVMHDFKEDQKARARLIPPDPERDYYPYYKHHRERRETQDSREHRDSRQHRASTGHRDSRRHEHYPQKEEEERHNHRRRTHRNSLQQRQIKKPALTAPTAAEATTSPSPSPYVLRPADSSFTGRMTSASASTESSRRQQRHQHSPYAYKSAKASDTIAQLSDAAPVTSRRDQERQELFCHASRRGGSSEHFLRRPAGGSGSETQPVVPTTGAQEKAHDQGLSGLNFGFKNNNDEIPADDQHRNDTGGLSRLDSLYLPRRNSNVAANSTNAELPRRSFFEPKWMQQMTQPQRLPVKDTRSSLPNPAASVVSDFSFVTGKPEKLDVSQQRRPYAPYSGSRIADDRRTLPSQSPPPPPVPAKGGSGASRRLRRTGDIDISQVR